MKFLFMLLAFACCAQAHAYPISTNVSSLILGAGARQFNTSRTATSVGCFINGATTCPKPPLCHRYHLEGFTPSGNACCLDQYTCRDGADQSTSAQVVEQNDNSATDDSVQNVFDQPRTEAYWGYITTTARSPSTGRGNSPQAKLDACMGYGQVDSYPNMGSLADNSQCRTDCDSATKNGYCNQTQTENGNTTQTNAACKDRCDCWMNASYGKSYNCEGL